MALSGLAGPTLGARPKPPQKRRTVGTGTRRAGAGTHGRFADATWGDVSGVDLFGPNLAVPDGVRVLDADEYERARILAGIPKMGAELTERTIPAETGLVEGTVSFTKGCYTGQELVARIDSRGSHVPRRLRGLRFSGPVEAGAELSLDGRTVGAVTSVAHGDRREAGWVGLGVPAGRWPVLSRPWNRASATPRVARSPSSSCPPVHEARRSMKAAGL